MRVVAQVPVQPLGTAQELHLCRCIRTFLEEDFESDDPAWVKGYYANQCYDYFYSPTNGNWQNPQPYYGVCSYSPDYHLPGSSRQRSTRYFSTEEFETHFQLL